MRFRSEAASFFLQLMASSTIGLTGARAVPLVEVVINCVNAPATVHSTAEKIALVHVKTLRRATNITAPVGVGFFRHKLLSS